MPRQGLGNSAIASVANEEQHERFKGVWAGMAITEPGCGSDSANIQTTAVLDGDEYVINGEKIYVTAGDRADASSSGRRSTRSLGRAAIKSFVVEKGTPGMTRRAARAQARHQGLRHRDDHLRRLPGAEGEPARRPDIDTKQGFAGAMATFDNTRPLVAAMALGCARAALELTRDLLDAGRRRVDYDRPALAQSAAAATYLQLEADWEAAHLLTLQAAWMADNRKANSLEASMAKAKAGRVGTDVTLRCVELAGTRRLQRAGPAGEVGAATPRSSTSSRAPSRSSS